MSAISSSPSSLAPPTTPAVGRESHDRRAGGPGDRPAAGHDALRTCVIALLAAVPSLRGVATTSATWPRLGALAITLGLGSALSFVVFFRLSSTVSRLGTRAHWRGPPRARGRCCRRRRRRAGCRWSFLPASAGLPIGWIARPVGRVFFVGRRRLGLALVGAGLGLHAGLPGRATSCASVLPTALAACALLLIGLLPVRSAAAPRWLAAGWAAACRRRRMRYSRGARAGLVGSLGYLFFDIAVLWVLRTHSAGSQRRRRGARLLDRLPRQHAPPGGIGVLDAGEGRWCCTASRHPRCGRGDHLPRDRLLGARRRRSGGLRALGRGWFAQPSKNDPKAHRTNDPKKTRSFDPPQHLPRRRHAMNSLALTQANRPRLGRDAHRTGASSSASLGSELSAERFVTSRVPTSKRVVAGHASPRAGMAEQRPAPARARRAADRHYLAVVAAEARRLAHSCRPGTRGPGWPAGIGEPAADSRVPTAAHGAAVSACSSGDPRRLVAGPGSRVSHQWSEPSRIRGAQRMPIERLRELGDRHRVLRETTRRRPGRWPASPG